MSTDSNVGPASAGPDGLKDGLKPVPHSSILELCLPQRNSLHLQEGDAQHTAEGEAFRKGVRDADAGTAQLEKVERRLSSRQHVQQLARQVLTIVGVQVQRLQ